MDDVDGHLELPERSFADLRSTVYTIRVGLACSSCLPLNRARTGHGSRECLAVLAGREVRYPANVELLIRAGEAPGTARDRELLFVGDDVRVVGWEHLAAVVSEHGVPVRSSERRRARERARGGIEAFVRCVAVSAEMRCAPRPIDDDMEGATRARIRDDEVSHVR